MIGKLAIGFALALAGVGHLFTIDAADRATSRETAPQANSAIIAQSSKPNGAPSPLKLLKVEPVKGYSGDSFTITGEGFPANRR